MAGEPADSASDNAAAQPSLVTVLREWGRIGCVGFGGPPAHIALLRGLCVTRRRWLTDHDFEDAISACILRPGPASTQLAIFCAWRVRGRVGALTKDLAAGRLTHVTGPGLDRSGEWCVSTLPPSARQPVVSELVRFITTPRCIQAMIRASGVGVTRFRPKIHVTLWS
ncbi:MAG: chromate transporter [Mycobacterium sp.]